MILRGQLFECLGIGISLVGQQNRHGTRLGDDGHEVRIAIPTRHHMLVQVRGDSGTRGNQDHSNDDADDREINTEGAATR